MGEWLALAILGAWLWREHEHTRERRALLQRVSGVTVEPVRAEKPAPLRAYGTDSDEWQIEQERLQR